ncbi:hypothetical protein T459_35320 [Capsicum annuum]|uniref:Uncharacterized protein n=1 Tax=Capsicum annuum TaxID=4072 RepID=A0A2G2XTL1_CAPAN|nr:hypothetical protein T459_35320 [Capsicum annuum]
MKVMWDALSMLMKLAILHALMKIIIAQPIDRRMESIKPRIQAMMEILITKYGGEGSSNGDIEVTECGGEDSISCHSGPQTEQDTNSFDVFQSVPERLEAKANLISVLEIQITCFIQASSSSKANVLNQYKSTEEQPIARKVVASRASCTEKVSHRLYQSVNRKRKKQRSNSYGEINFKATPMPAFYREPDDRSKKTKVL